MPSTVFIIGKLNVGGHSFSPASGVMQMNHTKEKHLDVEDDRAP